MVCRLGLAAVALLCVLTTNACVLKTQDGAVPGSPQGGTVLVRGGTFRMGTAASAIAELKRRYGVDFPGVFENEVPEHLVTLGDFRMDRCEVTNAQFHTFVRDHPEWSRARIDRSLHNGRYLDHWPDGQPPSARADHPVTYITWHAAQAFCLQAGGRLPTEAEWEYAARARGDREFPWGEDPPTPKRANYHASRVDDTTPVGSYPANPLGFHDLAGNVWEFVLDGWESEYPAEARENPVASGVPEDPRLVDGRRVVRGASYGGAELNLRTRWRDSHEVSNAVGFVGFRCAYAD